METKDLLSELYAIRSHLWFFEFESENRIWLQERISKIERELGKRKVKV
jgi:hypothetical protein